MLNDCCISYISLKANLSDMKISLKNVIYYYIRYFVASFGFTLRISNLRMKLWWIQMKWIQLTPEETLNFEHIYFYELLSLDKKKFFPLNEVFKNVFFLAIKWNGNSVILLHINMIHN